MKINKLFVFLATMAIATVCLAQPQVAPFPQKLGVCLKGKGLVAGTDLRSFSVSISAKQGVTGGYFQLATGGSLRFMELPVAGTGAKFLKIQETNNVEFICETWLKPETQSVVVLINYPPSLTPFCIIQPSNTASSKC